MRTPIFLVLLILLSACGSKNQTETTPANSLQDKVISTWEGLIPCADCPGILYNLELKNDSSYNSQMVYQEKPVDPVINSGRWSIDADGKIKLISSGKDTAFLLSLSKCTPTIFASATMLFVSTFIIL